MPNWTYNTLTVIGSKEDTDKFIAHAKGERGDMDFNRFKECPKELIETEEAHYAISDPMNKIREKQRAELKQKFGYDGWYDWCVQNWGTKWNACDIDFIASEDMGCLSGDPFYHFKTAWDSPIPIVKEMSKQFPSIRFELISEEESGEFYFEKGFVNGEEVSHEELQREDEENNS